MITVIVPAYNSETFLPVCLDSLLAQTYRDWEAIVVNDGSTDSTAEIAAAYAERDGRFKVISIPNSGLSTARNTGIDEARGEWIAFLDSDDALLPGAFEAWLRAARETDAEVSCGRFRFVTDITLERTEGEETREPSVRIGDGKTALLDILYQKKVGITNSACDKLWSRRFIGNERFLDGVYYEDLEFTTRMLPRASKVALTDEEVYAYREHPDSFLHTFSERRFDSLKVALRIEERSKADGETLRAARERSMSAAFNILWLLTINPERRRAYADMADRCWAIIRERRWASVVNSRVRLKNRCAALLSYLGRPLTEAALRLGNRFSYFKPPQSN
ncbi:MAG: glycosyltransferase family 2 protein [Duncaniella sp.]|nr:glycosyltransferase family 2 protein [Duncaniella sp.]